MTRIMDLEVAITAPGTRETMASLKQVEGAGKSAAAGVNLTTAQTRLAWERAGGDMKRFGQEAAKMAAVQVTTAKVAATTAQTQVAAQQQVEVATKRTNVAIVEQGRNTDALRMRVGMGAIAMAGALEMMARQGKVTGESLKMLVVQGSLMASMYGPQGALLGAVAVAGVALFSFFTRATKEAEELRKKTEETATAIRKMGMEEAGSGATEAFKPVLAQRSRVAQLEAQVRAEENALRLKQIEENSRSPGRVERDAQGNPISAPLPQAASQGALNAATATLRELEATHGQLYSRWQELAAIHDRGVQITREIAASAKQAEDAAENLRRLQGYSTISPPVSMGGVGGIRLPAGRAEAPGSMILPERMKGDPTTEQRVVESYADSAETQLKSAFAGVGDRVGQTFSASLAAGFSGGLDDFGATLMGGLGSIMSDLGAALLNYGLIMTGLMPALTGPGALFSSGPAAIAAGVALSALGGAVSGAFQGKGGGSRGGAGGGRSAPGVTAYALSPQAQNAGRGITARAPIVFSPTIIGENDPRAQRMLVGMVEKGYARRIA